MVEILKGANKMTDYVNCRDIDYIDCDRHTFQC